MDAIRKLRALAGQHQKKLSAGVSLCAVVGVYANLGKVNSLMQVVQRTLQDAMLDQSRTQLMYATRCGRCILCSDSNSSFLAVPFTMFSRLMCAWWCMAA